MPYPQWAPSNGSGAEAAAARVFSTSLTLRVGDSTLRVQPRASEQVKWALVQYLACLVPIALLGKSPNPARARACTHAQAACVPARLSASPPGSRAHCTHPPCPTPPDPAAWLLRRLLFGCHVVETSVYADMPRSRLHLE